MIRHLLLKRMESSIAAFHSTLESLINSNQNFRAALESGYVPVGNVATRLLAGQNFDPQEALDILNQSQGGMCICRGLGIWSRVLQQPFGP